MPVSAYSGYYFLDMNTHLATENNFIIQKGTKAFDLLPFDDSSNFAISEKFRNLLIDEQVSGCAFFPIHIRGLALPYYVFIHTSHAGPILNLDALNSYETEHIEFDKTTWDGSDIFYLKDTTVNVCVQRIKQLIEKHKLTNIRLKPL